MPDNIILALLKTFVGWSGRGFLFLWSKDGGATVDTSDDAPSSKCLRLATVLPEDAVYGTGVVVT